MKTKNQWASKLGFIMATAGAAIGLGNLWKFPYLMGRNGGASFLVVYLFFICILGVPVMMLEMSLGRKTRHDPVQAYGDIHPNARIAGGVRRGGGIPDSVLLQCHRRLDHQVYCKLWNHLPRTGGF